MLEEYADLRQALVEFVGQDEGHFAPDKLLLLHSGDTITTIDA